MDRLDYNCLRSCHVWHQRIYQGARGGVCIVGAALRPAGLRKREKEPGMAA
jgi:hypothetical protein